MAKKSKANHGDGTIFYSNSKGKWIGQINTGRDENGKIKRKSVYGDTQQEVKGKLNQIQNLFRHICWYIPNNIWAVNEANHWR